MTRSTTRKPPIPLLAAVLAALALAGCSATHVGESWQCPLAQGAGCDSVAAADPAVPDAVSDVGATRAPVLRKPLYRVRGGRDAGAAGPAPTAVRECDAGCGVFDPFGWLAKLFGAEDGEEDGENDAPADTAPESAAPESAALAAEPEPAGGDLRTGEVVARIWIAPFVDGGGVYREAAHVRAVLEPAGWRLK